jgi:hypothetical protein
VLLEADDWLGPRAAPVRQNEVFPDSPLERAGCEHSQFEPFFGESSDPEPNPAVFLLLTDR